MANSYKAPGRAHRDGVSLIELMALFPTEESAAQWFESVVWAGGRCCGKCGSTNTGEVPSRKPMPYWCSDCRSYFSVRTGTAIARSNVPLRKWAIAIYLCLTSLKSVSSMKLHRDLGVSQKTAWFMLHRIREAWAHDAYGDEDPFSGPVEADETYVGGKAKNMHAHQRAKLTGRRGGVDKMAVAGVKDRETRKVRVAVVPDTTGRTLRGFVQGNAQPEATVYTDGEPGYVGVAQQHEAVKHSVGEYVRGMAHTNGMESFWSMLKRAHAGTFHKMSPKHLERYVQEFAGKHNIRDSGTLAQMRDTVTRIIGRNLLYRDLIADNGAPERRSAVVVAGRAPASRAWRPPGRASGRSSGSFRPPPAVDVEVAVDPVEVAVDPVETLIHLVEAPVVTVKPLVDGFEATVHVLRQGVDLGFQAVELLIQLLEPCGHLSLSEPELLIQLRRERVCQLVESRGR